MVPLPSNGRLLLLFVSARAVSWVGGAKKLPHEVAERLRNYGQPFFPVFLTPRHDCTVLTGKLYILYIRVSYIAHL